MSTRGKNLEPKKKETEKPFSIWTMNAMQGDLTLADHLSGTPEPTFWNRWFGGWILPLTLAGYAIRIFVTGEGTLFGNNGNLALSGGAATAVGLAWLSVASFCHFHYFWPTLRRLGILTDLGKALSLVGFLGALGYVLWSVLIDGK